MTNWIYLIGVTLLLLVAALAVDLLASNMRRNVQQARTEAAQRKQVENEVLQLNASLEQRVAERTRELQEAQEKIMRQEKLAVLGQMAGSVGHELRNPMGVINSAIYYLKLVQPEADDKVKKHLAMIEQEVHKAEMIIHDLLDFARGVTADRELVSIPVLVKSVLVHFPPPASVEVMDNQPADLPKVFADPRQIELVLGNLMVNAYQAMPKGGQLSITSKKSFVKKTPFVCITLKDAGTGIAPENMVKLFEPLFTTKTKGIGLGLAISKKYVDANKGRIEVQSEPGQGSTFTVYLPIQKE
jgi:signal transduction histidine kinase